MWKIARLSMWGPDGSLIDLRHILALVSDNDLLWRMYFFYGSGAVPSGMTMDEFESLTWEDSRGYAMTWREALSLAAGIEQTYECVLVGTVQNIELDSGKVREGDFADCVMVFEGFDSSYWEVRGDPGSEFAVEAIEKIAGTFAVAG